MKKIALYIPSMGGGGAEKVFMVLANRFASEGYEVDLLLTVKEGCFLENLDSSINVIELSSKRVILDFLELNRYLAEKKPDRIISALTYCNIFISGLLFFSGYSKNLFVSEHTNITGSLKEKKIHISFLYKKLIKIFYKNIGGVIAVSEGIKKDMVENFGVSEKKIKVIYNPFDIEKIKKLSNETVIHPWLSDDREYKTIISVGRLIVAKDFHNLLSAMVLLKDKCNIRLIILGDGPLKKQLNNFVYENNLMDIVDLHGFVENPFSYISKADLFVSSSKREGFSNVLVESMVCNTPMIATNCPSGPAEILENGYWGDLVPTNNPSALAESIYKNIDIKTSKKLDYSFRIKNFDSKEISNQYLRHIFS